MTSGNPASCNFDGAKNLAEADSEAELCERFLSDFGDAMGERGAAGNFSFALSATKSGTINARISSQDGTVTRTYPEVSVDVMDRGLDYRDLSQLAKAAAQVVKMDQSSN